MAQFDLVTKDQLLSLLEAWGTTNELPTKGADRLVVWPVLSGNDYRSCRISLTDLRPADSDRGRLYRIDWSPLFP